jgi:hypothetical protein
MGFDSTKIAITNHKILVFFAVILLTSILNSIPSSADIVPNSVLISGGSNQIQFNDIQWRVYGSFLGPIPPGGQTTNEVDSCSVAVPGTFIGCNRKRLTADSKLTVTFSDDAQFQGLRGLVAYIKPNDTFVNNPINIALNQQNLVPQGGIYQVEVSWSVLCTALGGSFATDPDASAAAGTNILTCMDAGPPARPLSAEAQLAVGLAGEQITPALSEVIITLRIFTPDHQFGLFNPALGGATPIVGSDNYVNRTACTEANGQTSGVTNDIPAAAPRVYSGFCDFQIAPGDEKLSMVRDTSITNSLGSYSGTFTTDALQSVVYTGYALFLSNTDFANTFPWNRDSIVTSLYNIPGNIGSGYRNSDLTSGSIRNDVPVFARMASLDEAGNFTHLFGDQVIQLNCPVPEPIDPLAAGYFRYYVGTVFPTDPDFADPPPATGYAGRCPYATIPSLVTGLLTEDINCFVATALKGSPYDFQVLTLREFRNRFLKSFSLGRAFIDFYYEQGPKAAQWLNDNPSYKPLFRVLLWPPYIIAKVFNSFGASVGSIFLALLALLPFGFWKFRHRLLN